MQVFWILCAGNRCLITGKDNVVVSSNWSDVINRALSDRVKGVVRLFA